MKKKTLGVSKPAWMGALAVGLLTPLALWAVVHVNTNSIFEIDGNAVTTGSGDDWDQVMNATDSGTVRTFQQDPINATDRIFTGGGSKDERNISGGNNVWQHTTGAPPDKNNLNHAYAVAYQSAATDGDLHIYFGADRFANNGDSAIGFWFFKDNVSVNANGTFSGVHQDGDILVTSDFRNGGGVSVINVFKWQNNALVPVISGTPAAPGSGSTPFCLSMGSGANARNVACGIANRAPAPVPAGWPGGYIDKDGGTANFQISTLFEGGINVTQLLGTNNTCFSSFLAMTRTSASTTAQLKDFVAGAFPLCGVSIAKACNGTTTVVNDKFHTEYTITLTNTGGGPLFNASFVEETGKLDDPDYTCTLTEVNGNPVAPLNIEDGDEIDLGNLASGGSATGVIECDTPENGFENTASGIAFTDAANVGSVTADAVSDDCPLFVFSNAMTLVKDCADESGVPPVTVVDDNGVLTPQVCVDITVTNLRNEAVNDIQITDDKIPDDATEFPLFDLDAAGGANDEKTFNNVCYTPGESDDPTETEPSKITYTDTASASGTGALSGQTVASASDSASCPLCPCSGTGCN